MRLVEEPSKSLKALYHTEQVKKKTHLFQNIFINLPWFDKNNQTIIRTNTVKLV